MKDLKKRILLTCMGGYGALALYNNIKKTKHSENLIFFGSHFDKYLLSRSPCKENFLAPLAQDQENYLKHIKKIVDKYEIDLVIPKSDNEVGILSPIRSEIGARIYLPDNKSIIAAQDKLSFINILEKYNVNVAKTYSLNTIEDLKSAIEKLKKIDGKYWIRLKTAGLAGGAGAGSVSDYNDAKHWVNYFLSKRTTEVSEFIISEYLPGRLFEVLLLYREGRLVISKVYENLRYQSSENFSGISTPSVARTINDDNSLSAVDVARKAVDALSKETSTKAEGIYHMSVKNNVNNEPCVTEVNIGRYPSTCAFFDETGEYNTSEFFISYALDMPLINEPPSDPHDASQSNKFLVRSLDHEHLIVDESALKSNIYA